MGKAAKSNLRKVEQPVDHQFIPSPHALLANFVLIKVGTPSESLHLTKVSNIDITSAVWSPLFSSKRTRRSKGGSKVSLTRLRRSEVSTTIGSHRARDHPYHKQMLDEYFKIRDSA